MMVAVGHGAQRGTAAGLDGRVWQGSGLLLDLNGSKVKRFRFVARIPILEGRSCSRSIRNHGGSSDIPSA
jgi:hypothetical protein